MSEEKTSPRPWRLEDGFECEIVDATGRHVLTSTSKYAVPPLGDEREAANAALIVDAVNERAKFEEARMEFPDFRPVIIAAGQRDAAIAERDRLRDIVRRLCDIFTPGTIHPAGTMERLLREARAAIGEDEE